MLLVLAAWLPTQVLAESPKLSTAFRQKRLTVGDQFTVSLRLEASNDARIAGPLADSLGPFQVVGQKTKTRARRGSNQHLYDIKLAGFEPGSFTLPSFVFLVSQGDRIDTLRSDTLKVVISSVLPEKMADIHDLKPAESFPNHWLWLVPAGLLALAGLGYLGYRLYRRYRRYRERLAAPPDPWDEALRALDRIPLAEWLEKGLYKRYYYTLSEILKRYIERRYDFNAAEQTSTEIIAEMRRRRTPFRDEFADFIRMADLVKYAKHQPPPGEMPRAIEAVRGMVIRSRPIEGPAAQGGGAAPEAAA